MEHRASNDNHNSPDSTGATALATEDVCNTEAVQCEAAWLKWDAFYSVFRMETYRRILGTKDGR